MRENPFAVVTGASSGIGRETALALASKNYHVLAAARRLERLEELAAINPLIEPRRLDMADSQDLEGFCSDLAAMEQPVSVLINNAGYSIRGVMEEVPLDQVRRMYEVNFFGLCRVTQACLKGMRDARQGWIFNISSVAGKMVFPGNGYYSSTKHALEAVTDALRHEVAPFGIKVVAIRPGPNATEFGQVVASMSSPWLDKSGTGYEPVTGLATAYLKRITDPKDLPGPELISDLIMEVMAKKNPAPAYAAGPLSDTLLVKRLEGGDDAWRKFLDSEVGLDKLKL